jgi:hypothetical protein
MHVVNRGGRPGGVFQRVVPTEVGWRSRRWPGATQYSTDPVSAFPRGRSSGSGSSGGRHGCDAEADLDTEIRPERRTGTRAIERQGSQSRARCTEPDHPHRSLGGRLPAHQRPRTQSGEGAAQTCSSLGNAAPARRGQLQRGADPTGSNHASGTRKHQYRAAQPSDTHLITVAERQAEPSRRR